MAETNIEERQPLHVKYRPNDFEHFVGQGPVVKSLKKVLEEGRSRAYIFTGPSGVGKTTLARIIARSFKAELVEINAANHTGVDAMRDITEMTRFQVVGKRSKRTIIIDEAHMLTRGAWNVLLKPIEEPPKHIIWVFCTTEGSKIPDTIRTRCTIYDLQEVDEEDITALLKTVVEAEDLTVHDDVIDLIATKSEGSPRRALTFLEQCDGIKSRKEAARTIKQVDGEGTDDMIRLCRALAKGGLKWPAAMELVTPMKEQNPEGIRIVITHYFGAALLSAPSDKFAMRALNILSAFSDPYPQGGNYIHLLLSLGEIIIGGE